MHLPSRVHTHARPRYSRVHTHARPRYRRVHTQAMPLNSRVHVQAMPFPMGTNTQSRRKRPMGASTCFQTKATDATMARPTMRSPAHRPLT